MTAQPTGPIDLLDQILQDSPPAFALLHRPETLGAGTVEVLTGPVSAHATLAELPLPPEDAPPGAAETHDLLAMVPFRQVTERGYTCRDDQEPLLALAVSERETFSTAQILDRLPDLPIDRTPVWAEPEDDAYADIVRRIVTDEIGTGKGANFVIKRTFATQLHGLPAAAARTLFRRLLSRESGAYWTFLLHTKERTLVGACPERHLSLQAGTAVMNPVSGTYRYPASGPTLSGVLDFLDDRKEADELYMVVDEELKMMARISDTGGRVIGPCLKEMGKLAHTEYYIEGQTRRDPREILRETMFAPTVTGSPLESACRVIADYEPQGRGYYSGVLALIGRDGHGQRTMDSSILIRTADIAADGSFRLGVGSTLVRHSDPAAETAETHTKASTLLNALDQNSAPRLSDAPEVRSALEVRNRTLSSFWLADGDRSTAGHPCLAGKHVLVVDAEDTFTAMLARQLESLGLVATVRRHDEPYSFDGHDLVVMGPGPGDPRQRQHPKIAHLQAATRTLLEEQRPFLAVCLSHQVLAAQLGFPLVRRPRPHQGVQRAIDLFGTKTHVGFYNTFAARADKHLPLPQVGPLELSVDADSGELHALRGEHFASLQFHPESLLTEDGPQLLGGLLSGLSEEVAIA